MAELGGQSPAVALLGRDDAVRAQLRVALAELGANLVFEGELRGADAAAISAAQPAVVLLNLDAGGEDGLDGLEHLLLDPSMRVVFNEAETTAALSGWDLARWARHLAAKVLGHGQTIPPPPAGAEYQPATGIMPVPGAPPSPESLAPTLSMETLASEASLSLEGVPASSAPVAAAAAHAAVAATDLSVDLASQSDDGLVLDGDEIASALSGMGAAPAQVLRNREPDADARASENGGVGSDEPGAILIDMDELDAALAAIDAGDDAEAGSFATSADAAASSASLQSELEALAESDGDLDEDISLGVTAEHGDSEVAPGSRLQFSQDVGELADSDELDADVAALAAQLDALEDSAPKGEMVRDPDFFFDIDADEEAPAKPAAAPRGVPQAPDFSLTDELGVMQAAASRVTTEAPKIDISHLSLEALPDPGLLVAPSKPKPPADEPYLPRPGIDLMLAPLDEHLEKKASEDTRPTHARVKADLGESGDLGSLSLEALADVEDQATAHRGIPRVLVLGASIGGPDALRTFLAGLPADFPALLVLAQHLESGFFDRLAQQLQRVSKLPVRVASSDTPACAGEVMVIPSGERIRIQRDGRVRREPYPGPTHYRPCIDDVMRDIADAFGSRATAIIFSGMAGDAVEGAVYVTSKGGEVWAQTPDSCVVSSMVDGAQARGVVEFLGSPRELAEHCVARYGTGA